MNKHIYYSIAALSAVGLVGVGSVSAASIGDHVKNWGQRRGTAIEQNSPEHVQKLADVLGVSADTISTQLSEGKKMGEIFDTLGLDKEAVHQKMKEAHKQELAQKVAAGEITQEQADARLQKAKEFKTKMRNHQMGKGQFKPTPEKMAEALGLNIDEVKASLDLGKTMKDILEEKGIDRQAIHQKMKEAHKQELAQKVAAGEITQEQADKKLEKISERKDGDRPKMRRGMMKRMDK